MGGIKLCLLLLLGTSTLAQQEAEESPACLLAKRFKNFRRYVYNYEAETFNGVNGASDHKSGPKVACKVEIEVPQACSFILRTTECSLAEISAMESDTPVYQPAAGSEAFAAAMATNPLKITVEGLTDVKLFPEEDEPVNILNVKRGIVSALMAPVIEEEGDKQMATVHGVCDTHVAFNVTDENFIANDLTMTRDLSRCDGFNAHKGVSSPMALISGMHSPLSKLISSTQTCSYLFEYQKRHIIEGGCKEKHIFLPLSHDGKYGISTAVKQTLFLTETSKINDRVFEHNEANLKFLSMEAADDKSPVQSKDAAIAAMQELLTLAQSDNREKRTTIFHKLVSELRGLNGDILSPAALEMMDMSNALTFQALLQCGTPECTSAILSVLRTFDTAALEVDAAVYALGLIGAPSGLMLRDMLAMAQYKQSKPIMYAMSNVARKLYQNEGRVTPEIMAVSEFVASTLGADCAGDKELTFLTLRVVGNMGDAMEAADPAIKATLLRCMRQPATTLSVQLAAIQAFRRMTITDEVRSNLQRVSQYPKGATQKRLAAYLTLMRKPTDNEIEMVRRLLTQDQNMQVKAFVTSHVHNIIYSSDPETRELGQKLLAALEDEVNTHGNYMTLSRNYKLGLGNEAMQTNIKGNVIFDPNSQLPREVLLETTLKAFGYNLDIWEIGMEGKGFEPTIDTLFGKNGFFPDSLSKALYWTESKMPDGIREVLERYTAPLKTEGQRAPENIMRELVRNFNKLARDLQNLDSPETMAYLKLMGAELGYIKGNEMRFIADNARMYAEILLHIVPKLVVNKLLSGIDNEFFAHYIFMDNKFSLPTSAGLPLTFALSGTFAPGVVGGLRFSPNMQEVSFRPSVGVEFVTQMGVHIPAFVASTVEMHTSLFHESAVNAKISMANNNIRLSIPAPQGSTKFLRLSNTVMIVGAGRSELIPHNEGEAACRPLFSGIKYCTRTLRGVSHDETAAPYYPLNGETVFALDILPTNQVSEYTATMQYDLLREGEDGHQKVDSLVMALRIEGTQPTEATATMKYNRNMNVFTTQVQIPDFDMEAGIKVGVSDSIADGQSITVEVSNKNIPTLSLIGRAKLHAMTDGMLQVQMLVPSLDTDAAVTATMANVDGLSLEIKSDVKLLKTSSVQAVVFKYGEELAEVHLMSDMNADTTALVPYSIALRTWVGQFLEDVLDQRVPNTDMNLNHIVTKAVEASSPALNKLAEDVPLIEAMLNDMAEMQAPSLPDNLFLSFESAVKYQFNGGRLTVTIPLPLGGKSSEELTIPPTITTPRFSVPLSGLVLTSQEINIPAFTIPVEYDLSVPLMGMVAVSAKVNSNYYTWEGTASAGNNTAETPSYQAKFKVVAESPIELLAFTTEGVAEISDTMDETMKYTVDGSLKHKLLETSLSVMESVVLSDKILSTASYRIQASSPLGLDSSFVITSQCSLASDIFTLDSNMDGNLSMGSTSGTTTYSQAVSVEPMKREARWDSTLRMDCASLKAMNKVKASYANAELLAESVTNVNNEPLMHTTKVGISYKDVQFTFQTESVTKALDRMARSQIDLTASTSQVSLRIENQADDTENRIYSLLSGSVEPTALEINTDASVNVFSSRASHKSTLTLNTDGLTTSCTTTAQNDPMTFENVFHAGVDSAGATMSLNSKGAISVHTAELDVNGKIATSEMQLSGVFSGDFFDINTRETVNLRLNEDGLTFSNNVVGSFQEMRTDSSHTLTLTLRSISLHSKTDNILNEKNSYMHDITVNTEGLAASANVKNRLNILGANFANDAEFKGELFSVDLTGTMTAALLEEELKHTYEIKLADRVLSAKCNTNGKLLGSQMTHNTDFEIAGLTVKFNSASDLNTPILRVDSTLNTVAAPFTLNVDAILNSNGGFNLYGQQSGELYGKFLLKAEPLLFTHSLECRASSTHELEDGTSIKTSTDSKFNSMVNLQEQSVTLKMESKVNDHALHQELMAFNDPIRMGIEMNGVIVTDLRTETSNDYSMSGFVKYDKNHDSHLIQIPFIELLPVFIDDVTNTMMRLLDFTTAMLTDFDNNYGISTKFQDKISQLREVIDTFDAQMFLQDLTRYASSVYGGFSRLANKFPTEEILDMLKSVSDAIMAWLRHYNIISKFNAMHAKVEEILSSYEIENMIEAVMDQAIEVMRQYEVKEKIQAAVAFMRSIDIQPAVERVMVPVKELLNHLYAFDFKQLINDVSNYFVELVQAIKSFNYDEFTQELKQKVTDLSGVPGFGKLYGGFEVSSPHYKSKTSASLENSTTIAPEFSVKLNSLASSSLRMLEYTLDASANVAMPEMSPLTVTEKINFVQSCLAVDHDGTMTVYGLSAQASAKTTAKLETEVFVAEVVNDASLTTEGEVSAKTETTYKQNVNAPSFNIFGETSMNQKTEVAIVEGSARLTMNNLGNGKYAVQEYSDEATHKSDMELVMDLHTAKLSFAGATGGANFRMEQNVDADICIFRHIIVEAKAETETPFLKNSLAELKVQAKVEDMKFDLTASHTADLVGDVEATLSNSALALVSTNEIMLDTKNKANGKVALPFTLSGKVDLQNDVSLTLNSEMNQASWTGLARFNQYKYSHYFAVDNGEREVLISGQMNGEAHLDVLREPITIPEITVPIVGVRTPVIEDFSIWENTILGRLLITPQQTFDMSSKLRYMKNSDVITIPINVEPVFNVLNSNVRHLHSSLMSGKDVAAGVLASTLDSMKEQYEKQRVNFPNALPELSSMSVAAPELPAALRKLKIPKVHLPAMRNIVIPVIGDMTYEFALKTPMLTLKTDTSVVNQDDIIIRLDASSASEFEILNGKIEGTTTMNKVSGLKMASVLAVKHLLAEMSHDSSLTLSNEAVDTSIANSAKIDLPSLKMELNQELFGNSQEGLVVSVSSPSAGFVALQLQTKRPAVVKGRLFGRYPSEPAHDIDILAVKMSILDSEKLNLQTTWNMEIPNEVMLGMKNVPTFVSDEISRVQQQYDNVATAVVEYLQVAKVRSLDLYDGVVEKISATDFSELMALADNGMVIVKQYQRSAEMLLDAIITFLRETTFLIPGFEERLSGLQLYQNLATFLSDFTEEAVEKIPQYIAAMLSKVTEYIQTIEFTLPGSEHVVSGREILDDLVVAMKRMQGHIITVVKKVGAIQLEDIIRVYNDLMNFAVDKAEKLIETLRSQNVISTWLSDVYTDAMNSNVLADIRSQCEQIVQIVTDYLNAVKSKFQEIFAEMSFEQLNADIQSWIDAFVKRLNTIQNNTMEVLKEQSQNVEQYVTVSDRQIEVEVPFPFAA